LRNSTLPLVASLLLSLLALSVSAQKTLPQENPANANRVRCGTMEALEHYFNQNPAAREQYLRNIEEGQRMVAAAKANKETVPGETNTPQAIVTIPVVFHFVLGSVDQAKVTKADVIWQLNKLNEDFAGVNADSTNATNFYSIRGHSQIRFCLAQQDPGGNPTDGIDRVYSTITDFSASTVGTIKHATSCGADAWDPNRYFNIWVSRSVSLLGIATFPQTGAADEQGIAIALDGFSNNPAYVNPFFALGRTAVHEAGHYFGLYHSWGDDGTACSGDDFRQVPGTCLLPANLLLGDTPNQTGATAGCPSGVRTDNCSPASPGINYQNYMDYTDDACYSMFTIQQAARAEYILNTCRTSLLTSNGCTPVTVFNNDAGTRLMSPGNSCFPGGSSTTTFCQNSTFSAQIMLRNFGTTNLTSVKLNAVVGSGTVTTTNWNGNLAPFEGVIVSINNINAGAIGGTFPLAVYTTDPNGVADQRVSNDTATINVTISAVGVGVASVTEGFESATFPPAGWTLINPNSGSLTWVRTTNAKNSGTASAYINYYNYTSTGHLDQLISPAVNITDADSILVDFARAYKRYGTGTTFSDTLLIQLATQCGSATFPITAWKKGGNDLSTSPGTNTGNWFPAAADWGREVVDVKPFVPAGSTTLIVSFTGKNGYGQNLFLDDINIRTVILVKRDAQLAAILSPVSRLCSNTVTPSVRLFNAGKDTLKTVKILYRITGSSFNLLDSVTYTNNPGLPQGQGVNVNLKLVTLPNPGNFSIQAWTKEPNGASDLNTSNDTSAIISFRFVATVPLPLTESFESASFPPPNWARVNQDAQGTWFRTTAAARQGTASAVIDNYNYDAKGTNDDLETPQLSYSGIDSAFLTFQVAHATYMYPGSTGIPLDSFQVLVTKDCGQTYTTVYAKWGEDLQTVNDPNSPRTDLFVPNSPNQWRKESVNLTQVLGSSGTVQIVFRSKGNYGNTLLLDDINITTKTLPARLKQQGYMIAPNPFNGSFSIQHYLPPTSLRGIQVTNAAGQVIWSQNYSGNASSYINVNLNRVASGMYAVKLIYDNKVITERVIKRN
jgi:hypothetical protein